MKIDRQVMVFIIALTLLIVSIIYRVKHPFIQKEVDHLTFSAVKTRNRMDIKEENRHIIIPNKLISRYLSGSVIQGDTTNDLFSMTGGENIQKADNKKKDIREKHFNNSHPGAEIIKDLLNYRFCGTYKSKDKRAVFLVNDKSVLVASVGDRIDGKYLIQEIKDNYIRLKAMDIGEIIHIDMRQFNND